MQIGVAGMEVLRSLHSLRIVNPLRKCQMFLHLP